MKKYTLFAAIAAIAVTATAQETMYLVKGNNVVAKYNVDDIDYATFELPDGVTDITPGEGSVLNKTYISASPVYHGTDQGCGHFQIQLSTKSILEENPPLEFLYLQMSTPVVTDLKNIQIAEGTYTLGDPNAVAPFKFYPGIRQTSGDQEVAMGTVVVEKPDNTTIDYTFVSDGSFNVKMNGSQYTVSGMLKLENGNILEFSYEGPMSVINESDEQPPADEEPLPESNLTKDYTFKPLARDAYIQVYHNLFSDLPHLDYNWIMLYEDTDYANALDIALVVDREKYPDILLPKGKYPIFNRFDGSLSSVEFGACPAFTIKTDTMTASYGCWLKLGYNTTVAPLIIGEVEVLEDVTSWSNVKIRATFKDNAETPHTVTCEFSGSLFEL